MSFSGLESSELCVEAQRPVESRSLARGDSRGWGRVLLLVPVPLRVVMPLLFEGLVLFVGLVLDLLEAR